MTLADRAGLQQKDVLEVLELTTMASPMILEKGQGKNDETLELYTNILITFYYFSYYQRRFSDTHGSFSHAERFETDTEHG